MAKSRWKSYLALLLASLVLSAEVSAQQQPMEKFTRALNNLAHEAVTCAAFYYITSIGLMNRGDQQGQDMGTKQKKAGDFLLEAAAEMGRVINQRPEVVTARLELEMGSMRKEMRDNFVNYSLLQVKYLQPCADLAGNMAKRIEKIANGEH